MASINLEVAVEFADNPEPRCACVLLLDASASMKGEPIKALNEGLLVFKKDLERDELASRRVEIAIVRFGGGVEVIQDFVTIDNFNPPELTVSGDTPMGKAIHKALDLLKERKETFKRYGISYYRPWVFLITDGAPTDEWISAAERIKTEEETKGVAFFSVGVDRADMEKLKHISVREPVKLSGLNFTGLFVWLSRSTQAVAHSQIGEQIALPPAGWMAVES